MDAKIAQFRDMIAGSDNIVFFGGAGVSTESGIPDFRSVDGLYNQKWKYPPETILSHSFFERYPEEYYRFHREKLVVEGVKPNRTHLRLAELEREGKLKAVKMCWSCMAAFCAPIVRAAASHTCRILSTRAQACRAAAAAVSSGRTSSCMRNSSIRISCINPPTISETPTCLL